MQAVKQGTKGLMKLTPCSQTARPSAGGAIVLKNDVLPRVFVTFTEKTMGLPVFKFWKVRPQVVKSIRIKVKEDR